MKNIYKEFKEKQQKEINKLPIYFAFCKSQLDNKIKELGFESEEEFANNIFSIGYGGFALKKDKELIINTLKKQDEELKEKLKDKKFLISAFHYELSNHEYIYTYDKTETLLALGISWEEYDKNTFMQECMKIAVKDYMQAMEKMGY